MNSRKYYFIIVSVLCITFGVSKVFPQQILVNKAGYRLNSTKIVYFSTATDSFFVKDITNKLILTGKADISRANDPSTGMTIYKGNFSAVNQAGNYFIMDRSGNRSSTFCIADTVFNSVYKKSLKGFYFQRCGPSLLPQHAGVYQHAICHNLSDGTFHSSTDTTGRSDVTGGWHDAGDYGKYVVNAGITVGTLLMAYEMFPERFSYDDLNIPESGNSIPDILDEARYELDWLFKMQRPNGAVFFKVTHETFEGFIMPQNDNTVRYIYQISSTATADFAAMMARAYRVFKNFDHEYSDKCLSAAIKAWSYLEAHPSIFPTGGFRNPSGTGTGEYGDGSDSDERLWAAAELFESTGDTKYSTFYLNNYKSGGIFSWRMSWQLVRTMANLTYLFGTKTQGNQTVISEHRTALLNFCTTLLQRSNNDGLNVSLQSSEYTWGSNADVLNNAMLLIAGYKQNNSLSFYNAALYQLNYILGANANNISYITGIGDRRVMNPHHRPSGSDGIVEPVPGLLAGGPNKDRQDDTLRAYTTTSTPSALCYVDNQGSYSSNENCINWNAPLVFVAGYFNGEGLPVGINEGKIELPTEMHLAQNYPNPFNPSTTISWQSPVGSWQTLKIYDVLGNEVVTLVDEYKPAGSYEVEFNTLNITSHGLASGVYFCHLEAGQFAQTRKMILLR